MRPRHSCSPGQQSALRDIALSKRNNPTSAPATGLPLPDFTIPRTVMSVDDSANLGAVEPAGSWKAPSLSCAIISATGGTAAESLQRHIAWRHPGIRRRLYRPAVRRRQLLWECR